MRFSFNYYKKLDDVEFYLCNPDGRELFPIVAKERNVTLRFNDLSVIEFQVPAKLEKSDGTIIEKAEYYDYIETMRLIYATKIGWFKITSVIENDAGTEKSKSVQAESLQSVFKNKGFVSEERVYKFYNPRDPYDATYVSSSESAIPSVVGQMYQQLGIKIDINQGLDEPETPYEDWTLTYVNPSLIYEGSGSICRTLKDRTAFGYEWMVNDVEDAFKVVFVFDFYNKAIQVKTVAEITERANLCLSFHNFMKNIQVSESADDIVTVLSCNGNGVDITQVNPTGTNYIVDFSYYMDVVNHRWMSTELINKINVWKAEVEAAKPSYVSLVTQLKSLYLERTEYEAEQKERNVAYENLLEANAKYSASLGAGSALSGIVAAETVGISDRATILGEDAKVMSSEVTTSLDSSSAFNKNSFASTKSLTCYTEAPEYDEATGTWYFTGTGRTASATDNYNTQDPTSLLSYVYFIDGDGKSYCKLSGSVKLDADGDEYKSSYYCDGFVRYVAYSLATTWLTLHKNKLDLIQASIDTLDVSISAKTKSLNEISSKLNILSYFSSTPNLLRELNCYWIEGDYTDDNISASDEATTDELIDLANELLDSGEIELSKVSQPRFSFSLEAANFMHQYEFRSQLFELQLGKIITVEKEEGLWYYPALLELSFSLDNADDFSMTFANSLRLDDWGYTYADLIADASSTARQVSANWKELMSYAKERENIDSLIKNPLDTTLRAAYANMSNQEFVINDMGILGRKAASDGSGDFDKEQVRLINNLILFTDDNWETIKTALGKIYYTDSTGQDRVEYGLIGETIIGRLLMGEKLEILNQNSTVKIDGSGIIIKKPIYDEDGVLSEYQTMFEANADTGKLYVLEAEITGNIKGGTINISDNFLVDRDGNVTIKKGSININDNFIVDDDGNVQLNGSIVWGTGNSPTQIVYANTAFVKPSDGTKWSSFPEANSNGWHRKYVASDYFASYTYDGGNTWTDAIQIAGINGQDGHDGANGSNGADGADGANGADGSDGDTVQVVYLYYSKSDSSAPSKPTYSGGTLPTGWTLAPQSVTASYPYVFVSQCTVTNGVYGTWSTPTCWAKYGADGADGADGSDASVTDINVFNALTSNGTMYGCFSGIDNKLYINATYIKSKQTDSELVLAGKVVAKNLDVVAGTFTGSIVATNNISSNNKTLINENGIYFGNSFSTNAPSYIGDSVYSINNEGGSWAMSNIAIYAAPTITSTKDAYYSGLWYLKGWTITPDQIKFRGSYNGHEDIVMSTSGISSHFIKIVRNDTTGSDAYLQFWATDDDMHASMYMNWDDNYFMLYSWNHGIGIGASGSDSKLWGTWYGSLVGGSSRNIKKDIERLTDKHAVLFDNLIPRSFKFIDGESGRTHYGYVVDELKTAMDIAGLSSEECAAYCLTDPTNPDGDGGIRYDELAVLTTYELQKLKQKVVELELLIQQLQERN